MKNRELAATLAHLKRLLADPRLDNAHWKKLRKGYKELEKVGRSGKLDPRRVFRATELISSTLVEKLQDTELPTQPDSPGLSAMSKVNR